MASSSIVVTVIVASFIALNPAKPQDVQTNSEQPVICQIEENVNTCVSI